MRVFLGLGSNVGERLQNLQAAVNLLDLRVGTVVRIASVYETAPVYVEDQPSFLNTVVELETKMPPGDLLRAVKDVEREIGRISRERFGPREIDVDLLLFKDGTTV
ncbi:MAG: 2-amino-4-hydroxy-6-hydroxymethyldihydropteridine diphosphokinase, partial [Armatimonadota bacterium]